MFRAFSKIGLINISLAVFVVFFEIMSFDVWSQGNKPIQEIQPGKSSEKPLPGKGVMERTTPPESTYGIVAEKNLFSSNRSEFIPEKPKPGPGVEPGPLKISEKMIFLYGVVLMGDNKQALISNPETEPQAGKKPARDKWVKVGDTMGQFNVADIKKDRIILAEGANTREILLYDKNKPARKIIVPEKSAAPAAFAAGTAVKGTAVAEGAAKSGTEQPKSAIAEGKNAAAAGEYIIVNTPFGPTKRRVQ
ncbi:MAG: hypothetical protein NTY86_04745 [Deltaproteobacteria bacterium]|nr:hypothetical protein [Deltaproteobacteria bacterium]